MSTFTTVAKEESILTVVRNENCQRPQENLDSYKYISFLGNPLAHGTSRRLNLEYPDSICFLSIKRERFFNQACALEALFFKRRIANSTCVCTKKCILFSMVSLTSGNYCLSLMLILFLM